MEPDAERLPDPTSQIAQERVLPGPPSPAFWGAAALVGVAVFAVLVAAGLLPEGLTASEGAASQAPLGLADRLGREGARLASSAAIAAACVATGLAARRLLHSDGAGILAAVLLALDPGTLGIGRLALPDALALAFLTGALAATLAPQPWAQWLAGGLLAAACLADPRAILWGLPVALLALLRGHIYAAPRHVGESLLQGLVIPGTVTVAAAAAGAWRPACTPALQTLALSTVPVHGPVALAHNPVLWLGGLATLLALGVAVLVGVGRTARIARLPGRIQFRLPDLLHPMHGRVLWLLLLGLLAPAPAAWAAVAALALAAGIVWLSEDAPGFGLAVALVLVGFGVVGLARSWPLVTGLGSPEQVAELVALTPWSRPISCG